MSTYYLMVSVGQESGSSSDSGSLMRCSPAWAAVSGDLTSKMADSRGWLLTGGPCSSPVPHTSPQGCESVLTNGIWLSPGLNQETARQKLQCLLWPSEVTHCYFCGILLARQASPILCGRDVHKRVNTQR